MKYEKVKLKEISSYVRERVETEKLNEENYISTENMASNKGGKVRASKLPNSKSVIAYKPSDVLISNIRPYFKKIWFSNTIGGSSADVLVIRPNEKVIPDYLYYFLSQDKIFDYMVQTSKGTKMPRGDKQALMDYELAIPNLDIQKNISKFFSNIDKKIEINNSLISNLEELAQTLFKRWFVDFEFPNEEGKPYKSSGGKMVESELGMIPEGWNLNKLNEISKLIMGLSPKSSTYNEEGEGLPLLNGAADFNGSSLAPKRYTSDPKRVSIKSDLILCIRATIGNLTYSDSEYALGRGVAAIRPYKREYSELLYHFVLKSINRLKALATGSVISGLSKPDLENIIILVPDAKKLNKFHNVFSSIQLKQQQLSEENIRLVNMRDTLLPKLLSGEVELPDDMEVTDDVPIS